MEASYDILGDVHSEGGSAASVSGEEPDDDAAAAAAAAQLNGEDVRGDVEEFAKATVVRTTLSSVAFFMAIVGIWGDGVAPIYSEAVVYL